MLVYIALGGLLGTISRFGLQGWVQARVPDAILPYGTVTVNIVGSFALGFIMRYATGSAVVSPELRAGLTIGFLGAFTTMSTFAYESVALMSDGEYTPAILYMGVTLVGSLVASVTGLALASRIL